MMHRPLIRQRDNIYNTITNKNNYCQTQNLSKNELKKNKIASHKN